MAKQCFKCLEIKPITEFYKHPAMGDGHLGKCKTCAKRDVAERFNRLRNNPEWLTKERERCRKKQDRYRKLGIAKQTSPESRKRWADRNKHKLYAQSVANRAFKNGSLKKPKSCERCGKRMKLQKHHPDYSRPLLVEWVCPPCHGLTRRK